MTTTTKNIYQRILGVMGDVDYIQKSDKKVNNQYRFVSHDQVNSVLHPYLVQHGIAVIPTVTNLTQEGNRTSVCLNVSFINADNPTDKIDVIAWGYGIDPSDKGPGKAVSYAYKYALLKTFCLETGDDPDQDQSSRYEPPKQPEEAPTVIPKKAKYPMTAANVRHAEQMLSECDDIFQANVNKYLVGLKVEKLGQLAQEKFDSVYDRILNKLKEMEADVVEA